jgi:hypothetical protein
MVEDVAYLNIVTNDEWILFQSFNEFTYNSKTGSTKIINLKMVYPEHLTSTVLSTSCRKRGI